MEALNLKISMIDGEHIAVKGDFTTQVPSQPKESRLNVSDDEVEMNPPKRRCSQRLQRIPVKASEGHSSKSHETLETVPEVNNYSFRELANNRQKAPEKASETIVHISNLPIPMDNLMKMAEINHGLFEQQPEDATIAYSAHQSCKFMMKKLQDIHDEMNKMLDEQLTCGPMGTLQYLNTLTNTSKNFLTSLHHILMAESFRTSRLASIVQNPTLGSRIVGHKEWLEFQAKKVANPKQY